MAKPVLIITVDIRLMPSDMVKDFSDGIKKSLDYEYHVLINLMPDAVFKVECFNDCKGLLDVDIEQLIKDLQNGKE